MCGNPQRRAHDPGPFLERNHLRGRVGSALAVNREVSGVTAAALAIRRTVYDEVGGLSEAFPVNFGDVDLSLKVSGAGYRILWIAAATAYHFEARSREPVVSERELETLARRWWMPRHDKYLPDQPGETSVRRPRISTYW
jgi:GT2 family glycosyltransferase